MRHACFAVALFALACITATHAGAQARNFDFEGFEPTGVYIDPDGVLQSRRLTYGRSFRALLRKAHHEDAAGTLKAVSIPGSFAEAKRLLDAGQTLPDELAYLGGITKVRYLLVDEANNDLLLVGLAEPINTELADRPIGTATGRPVCRLEDLAVALRTAGPGQRNASFGCLIEQTPESARAMLDAMRQREREVQSASKRAGVLEAMADAAGPQNVRFFGIEPNTRFALTALEADFLLKRMVIGLDRQPVRGIRSFLAMQTKPSTLSTRFWFEVDYEPLLVAEDGSGYEIRGQSLQVLTQRHFRDTDKADPVAEKYAEQVTEKYPQIATAVLPFADLANLSDLSLVAAIIGTDKLDRRVSWDASWVLDAKDGFPVSEVEVPETAETLVNYAVANNVVIFMGGGVELSYTQAVKDREADEAGAIAAAVGQLRAE